MRLGNLKEHCGCDSRRFIMFEAGRLGLSEALILTLSVTTVFILWRKNA